MWPMLRVVRGLMPKLSINNFKERRYDYRDAENVHILSRPKRIWLDYLNENRERIAYISYYTDNGQIALFSIREDYQSRGLGKQILFKVQTDLIDNNCKEMWVVTHKDHPFWANALFTYRDPAHPSVRTDKPSDGYFKQIM